MLTIAGPVILDLNTQRDLFASDGVYPLFQADKFNEPLKKLFNFANKNQVPIISTRFSNLQAPGQSGITASSPSRLICHPSSPGYQKVASTQLRRRKEWPLDCGTSLPVDGFNTTQQYVFDLPNMNLFECPRLDRLLSESTVEVFLIAGAPLEWTVRTAVLGLLARRHKIAMISDCIGMWDPYEGDMALRQIESKNVEWLTVDQVDERYNLTARTRATRAARAAARAKARVPAPVNMTMKPKSNSSRGAFRV
jgi:nicotinamidase-related amidase